MGNGKLKPTLFNINICTYKKRLIIELQNPRGRQAKKKKEKTEPTDDGAATKLDNGFKI